MTSLMRQINGAIWCGVWTGAGGWQERRRNSVKKQMGSELRESSVPMFTQG
ncbi:hypothetical protein E2C01_058056 [Portunus trituberculatus]|uniref:Uncharacterized protein n=1 Tax=Portunus trituberculatus TaxID=210409 RepID=A0A5B7H4A0_PORTR|nr:hypothetical protein [Portunus trituberculatus]